MSEIIALEMAERAEKALNRYGLATLLALALSGFLMFVVYQQNVATQRALTEMELELRAHMMDSVFYMHALCINSADNSQKIANCQAGIVR